MRNIFSAILILTLISCSKSDKTPGGTAVKNCKIIAASIVSGTGANLGTYTFQYNSDGKLTGSLSKGAYTDTVSYSYSGNMIFRSVAAGPNSSVDTIALNNTGFILHDKEVVGSSVYKSDYVYDGSGQLSSFTQQQNSYPPISVSYVFTNGDNTLISSGSAMDTLVYDISKMAVNGNLDQFNQLLYLGAYYVRNKHLLIAEKHGTSVAYSYQFDSNGNISSIKMTVGNNSATINYTYSCQ